MTFVDRLFKRKGRKEFVFPGYMEEEFKEIYLLCKDYTMTSVERMYALYQAVNYISINKIPGDIVECGVWKGGSSMLVGYTLQRRGDIARKIYLYDTFEGMPAPGNNDVRLSDDKPAAALLSEDSHDKINSNNWCIALIDEVQKNLQSTNYPVDKLVFIKGKVEDTIPRSIATKISILRLDTDWFESTYHELTHLFPLVSKNGVLIIDDYGHWKGSKLAVDKYFSENGVSVLLNRIDYTGRIGIKS